MEYSSPKPIPAQAPLHGSTKSTAETTASNLGIAGTFTNNQLNGSFQKSISIASTDTLSDVATKINNLNAGVSASIINDGSGSDALSA